MAKDTAVRIGNGDGDSGHYLVTVNTLSFTVECDTEDEDTIKEAIRMARRYIIDMVAHGDSNAGYFVTEATATVEE